MMLTMSPNKDTSRSHLMDPTKTHQLKQIELYQKNAQRAMAAADSLDDLDIPSIEKHKRAESTLVLNNKAMNNMKATGHSSVM